MASVTGRIDSIMQPRGGYLNPKGFETVQLVDSFTLHEKENIHSSLIGLAVDYLTRFEMGMSAEDAFGISLLGVAQLDEERIAAKILKRINGLDDDSIFAACQLVGYDVCYRAGVNDYKDFRTIKPDQDTIENIRIMVNRCISFFNQYGPIRKIGFTFEGGYTDLITKGDGDYLTEDTLWDIKVSKNLPSSKHTLQLLVYYLLGKQSIYNEFDSIVKIGLFNPRTNCIFLKNVSDIPIGIIHTVSADVIGYEQGRTTKEVLSVKDIMSILHCNKEDIKRLYLEKGLPLKKTNNGYSVRRNDFRKWLEQKGKKRPSKNKESACITAIKIATIVAVMIAVSSWLLYLLLK